MSAQQQAAIIARCKEVVAKAKELYGMDLSQVQISFNLRGRAAGKAGGRGYRMPGSAYYVKFNHDMLTREAFDHVINDTVPHEYAHVVCYMDPNKGSNHDYGWARVCRELGGSGARTHTEEVVYGKGTTYEYTTDRGHKVRMGDRHHRYIQGGGALNYKHGKGRVSRLSAYSIVGMNGRSLEAPVVRKAVSDTVAPDTEVRQRITSYVPAVQPAVTAVVPTTPAPALRPATVQPAGGQSKAAISRNIMFAGYRAGHSYETIIAAMIAANGYDRQLARATFKANAPKVGIPASFY